MDAWYLQGLPQMSDTGDYEFPEEFYEFVGMERLLTLPVETDAWPPFETRVIEENEKGRIWVDETGVTIHDAGKSLTTPGFRTRTFLSHPVKNREDWQYKCNDISHTDENHVRNPMSVKVSQCSSSIFRFPLYKC